ncbi:MAG: transposase [Bacteroidota bacterium]
MKGCNYIGSLRLKRYQYSHEGAYFITICLKPRLPLFGHVWSGSLYLSPIGAIAYYEWRKTFDLRKNISIDEFIIMPDHMHGIVWIGEPQRDYIHNPFAIIRQNPDYRESFGPHNSILANIIKGYKGAVTRSVRKNVDPQFSWQRGYYERIIKTEVDLHNVRRYIRQNPTNW